MSGNYPAKTSRSETYNRPHSCGRWVGIAIATFGISSLSTACHHLVGPGTSRYAATATYVAQARGGDGSHDVTAAEVRLVDCKRHATDRDDATLEVGDRCRLQGSWVGPPEMSMDEATRWRVGTVVLAPAQLCWLDLSRGMVLLRVSTGVVRMSDARILDVALAGEVASGSDAGARATLNLTAAPSGPVVDSICP